MKYLTILLILITLFSCSEKAVQLPETHLKNITEIRDVSPAYLFYNEETDSVEFNRKNIIGTTNWLVNVDKRLSLKQAIPHIIYLQNKRKKAGMHKNEKAKNYFTCSNRDINNLSFIDFTEVEYEIVGSKKHKSIMTNNLDLFFNSSQELILNDTKVLITNLKSEVLKTETSKTIALFLNSNLTFQDYITLKSELLKIESDSLKISNHEIIYN